MHPSLRLSAATLMSLLPVAARAQISFPVSINRVAAHVTLSRSGVSVGSHGVSAHVPWSAAGRSGTSRTTTRPVSTGTRTTTGTATGSTRRSATRTASAILADAEQYQGIPYVWGGETTRGFDCSGFVQFIYRRHGIELPRVSRDQARVGRNVAPLLDALQPGDLMFFDAHGNDGVVDHVGMYAGDGRMIHSSSSGNGVREESLGTSRGEWFLDHMIVARRVIQDGQSLVDPGFVNSLVKSFARSGVRLQFDPRDDAPRPR